MQDHYTFLSWVRDGAAALADQPEELGAGGPVRARLDVGLDIEALSDAEPARVDRSFALLGPGDVTGLDGDEILRMEPAPGALGVEPNRVASVEFRRADLPWLFSPRTGSERSAQRLRPWLSLVVVPADVATLASPGSGHPFHLTCPVAELPEPADSWAWAHAQVLGLDAGESIHAILENEPERAIGRLISPRRLEPGRRHVACLVPTFRIGVEAVTGGPIETDTLTPAWPSPFDENLDGAASVTLPVYHHWSFTTGPAGDFESLARRLAPHAITRESAVGTLDVGEPGAGVIVREPDAPPERLPFSGALTAAGHVEQRWSTAAGERFAAELRRKFEAVADATTTLVAPPLYGRWHADTDRLPADGAGPHWLRDVNLDPRLRAYAALGVRTVQENQEALMASAWEQLDEIEAVEQAQRQARLARAVGAGTLRRRYRALRPATLMQLTRGVHDRVAHAAGDGTDTVADAIARSEAPTTLVSSTLRRVARPEGPLVRRSRAKASASLDAHAFVAHGGSGEIRIDTEAKGGFGMVVLDDAISFPSTLPPPLQMFRNAQITREAIEARRLEFEATDFDDWIAGAPPGPPFSSGVRLSSAPLTTRAFSEVLPLLAQHEAMTVRHEGPPAGFPDFGAMADELRTGMRPEKTVADAFGARLATDLPLAAVPLEAPVAAAPFFPQPMADALREIAPGMLLAGAEGLPPDSVSLMRGNTAFVYSYLIGLNHAMADELLWRGFPTDRRGTSFRHFWDRTGFGGEDGSPEGGSGTPDIPPLDRLPPTLRLLGHGADVAADALVLVVRGELLRRFPDTGVLACPAVTKGAQRIPVFAGAVEPTFAARLDTDTVSFSFGIDVDVARGSDGGAGWFIVFREPPSGLRFGLDETPSVTGPPGRIDDLAWDHVLDRARGDRHASPSRGPLGDDAPLVDSEAPANVDARAVWAANGAHVARCLVQRPVSVAIHAETLLPAPFDPTAPTPR